jgi:hypothetical protein
MPSLGMALPYLTTKTNRVDQRGRFGIGLKTLNRIAQAIAVHSDPYHFSGNQLSLVGLDPEPPRADSTIRPAIPCWCSI